MNPRMRMNNTNRIKAEARSIKKEQMANLGKKLSTNLIID